ncbi:MAG: hypothetical protein EZS28_007032 [Streblomastix strix]|uniref:Calcineurin-like phosphoesterase domain-containing protein n=1 Tax=Streblomastix strix TaxID=222440 RepID=A0A5J4WR78_9EUKA|nr:MAG: hypothetical protein EZS28_007032 [Streblomastix strix]
MPIRKKKRSALILFLYSISVIIFIFMYPIFRILSWTLSETLDGWKLYVVCISITLFLIILISSSIVIFGVRWSLTSWIASQISAHSLFFTFDALFPCLFLEIVFAFWDYAYNHRWQIVLVLVSVLILYQIIGSINGQIVGIRTVNLRNKKIGKTPLRIVHLSDIHIGTHRPYFLKYIVKKVNALNADVVCITGDLIDSAAMSRHIFFVNGNHDRSSGRDAIHFMLRLIPNPYYSFLRIIGIEDGSALYFEEAAFNILSEALSHQADLILINPQQSIFSLRRSNSVVEFSTSQEQKDIAQEEIHEPEQIPDDISSYIQQMTPSLMNAQLSNVSSPSISPFLSSRLQITTNSSNQSVQHIQIPLFTSPLVTPAPSPSQTSSVLLLVQPNHYQQDGQSSIASSSINSFYNLQHQYDPQIFSIELDSKFLSLVASLPFISSTSIARTMTAVSTLKAQTRAHDQQSLEQRSNNNNNTNVQTQQWSKLNTARRMMLRLKGMRGIRELRGWNQQRILRKEKMKASSLSQIFQSQYTPQVLHADLFLAGHVHNEIIRIEKKEKKKEIKNQRRKEKRKIKEEKKEEKEAKKIEQQMVGEFMKIQKEDEKQERRNLRKEEKMKKKQEKQKRKEDKVNKLRNKQHRDVNIIVEEGRIIKDHWPFIYVSPGTGTWGCSMRTIGRSEITLIIVSGEDDKQNNENQEMNN